MDSKTRARLAMVATLASTLGGRVAAADYDHAAFRIIVANKDQVVGLIETHHAKAGPLRPATFAIYSVAPLDAPGQDGKFIGMSDLSVFRAMVDCSGWTIRALAADYYLTSNKTRRHRVEYDKALYMPAEDGPPDVIARKVCGNANTEGAAVELYHGLDAFVAAAKARF
jgi:hypothetical protein